jgi:hypothetical protein
MDINKFKLKKWLNTELKNNNINSVVFKQKFNNTPLYYCNSSDIDIEMNDESMIYAITTNELVNPIGNTYISNTPTELGNILSLEDNNTMLIPYNKNRKHALYLFKQSIDCVFDNRLNLILPQYDKDTNTCEFIKLPLFTKTMKKSFYEFCMNNSN